MNTSSSAVQVVDAARRALNALRRMRLEASRNAHSDRRAFLDQVMLEEEALAVCAIERLTVLAGQELGAPQFDA